MRFDAVKQKQPLSDREGDSALCREPGNLPIVGYGKRNFPNHEDLIVPFLHWGVVSSVLLPSGKGLFCLPERNRTLLETFCRKDGKTGRKAVQ